MHTYMGTMGRMSHTKINTQHAILAYHNSRAKKRVSDEKSKQGAQQSVLVVSFLVKLLEPRCEKTGLQGF